MHGALRILMAVTEPVGTETEGTGPGPIGTVVFVVVVGVILGTALVLYLRHRRTGKA